MTSQIVTPAVPSVNPEPTCDYCGAPKPADGSRFCCTDHFIKYQLALAATLKPLTTRIQTRRERKGANRG